MMNVCKYCEQEFKHRPNLFALKDRPVKYCSQGCANKAQKRMTNDKMLKYKCKTCGSLVRGNINAKARKYCTDKCRIKYGNVKTTKKIQTLVEVLEPGPGME